jgi:DNA-binding NtrC family response regulator
MMYATLTPTLKTILLVEGEPLLLKFLRLRLEKGGFTVLPTSSADEAMRMKKRHLENIHLLLVSLTMSPISGVDVARTFERRRPGLPIILMSGYPDGATIAANNGWHFIPKPFDPNDLLSLIKRLLQDCVKRSVL